MRGTVRGDLKLFETHDCNINPTVNNGILARLVSFKIDPEMK